MTKERREAVRGRRVQNDKMRRAAKMRVKLFLSEFQALACKKNVMLLVSPHVGFLTTDGCARKVSRYRRRLIKARNKSEQLAGRFHLISGGADLRRGRGSRQAARGIALCVMCCTSSSANAKPYVYI